MRWDCDTRLVIITKTIILHFFIFYFIKPYMKSPKTHRKILKLFKNTRTLQYFHGRLGNPRGGGYFPDPRPEVSTGEYFSPFPSRGGKFPENGAPNGESPRGSALKNPHWHTPFFVPCSTTEPLVLRATIKLSSKGCHLIATSELYCCLLSIMLLLKTKSFLLHQVKSNITPKISLHWRFITCSTEIKLTYNYSNQSEALKKEAWFKWLKLDHISLWFKWPIFF
jgi:hypothetical protein